MSDLKQLTSWELKMKLLDIKKELKRRGECKDVLPEGALRWIPSEERKPEESVVSVLASGVNKTTGSQWREILSASFVRSTTGFVTHWMPLPDLPALRFEQTAPQGENG